MAIFVIFYLKVNIDEMRADSLQKNENKLKINHGKSRINYLTRGSRIEGTYAPNAEAPQSKSTTNERSLMKQYIKKGKKKPKKLPGYVLYRFNEAISLTNNWLVGILNLEVPWGYAEAK